MTPEQFTDEERAALARALRQLIDADRFPMAPRLKPLKSALAKLDPTPERAAEPLPPPKPWTNSSIGQRRGRR